MTSSATPLTVRASIVEKFRRDLVGPDAQDADLSRERLNENPSRWYLTGFLAPVDDPLTQDGGQGAEDDISTQEELEIDVGKSDTDGAGGASGDADPPEVPNAKRRFLPSSIGLTVLLPHDVTEIQAVVSWGDYRTEPPLPESVLLPDEDVAASDPKAPKRPKVDWVRAPQQQTVRVPVPDGRGERIVVPESAAAQRKGGGLVLEAHARLFTYETPDGSEQVRALTVFLVNRRAAVHRRYADVSFVFQAKLELISEQGFRPRRDLSGFNADDPDLRVADLHYCNVCEYGVGRNVAAGWSADEEKAGHVAKVWTDPMPQAEVERVAPNEDVALKSQVAFDMARLAEAAAGDGADLAKALSALPQLYAEWIDAEGRKLANLAIRRRETAEQLIAEMKTARDRIAEGIDVLSRENLARAAFRFMNLAVSAAARRRDTLQSNPTWRPFQLAFILVNLAGLSDRTHKDREIADLLFFPTGGGKTEAYLGLAAFVIAHRRLKGSGVLGAGVAVIMRYTLRLLTLDQLSRAAGVVCALELMRTDPVNVDGKGHRLLGDWPIEIGLWVGSDASPNRLGSKGDADQTTAVGRVRRYKLGQDKRAPAPLKACPWCATPFTPQSFACVPNDNAPNNMVIRCANTACDFTRDRPLPILTVDDPIYQRLPAFLIATVDKFASLPWEGRAGAFFGQVDRFQENVGFYGAAEPRLGRKLDNGWMLDPPDLIIQDELHLISGPLGTVAGLYEAAIDQLASRRVGGNRVRPKIVASTATVRRASQQIAALFDRHKTSIFPPPGIDRTDSFFARTVASSQDPARLYLGIAAQGKGPKLVFLRALTTLLTAAQAEYDAQTSVAGINNPADPYMTALCYFNALRELGGARRIVEDEVHANTARYGADRRRVDPSDAPFADRTIREPMEITSRVSTDEVALAKQRLDTVFGSNGQPVDVALATNMISVGLDILRLGLMVVQSQPKTAAEYIQATSRIGRDHRRPGLVVVILNMHKPRDRAHFEQFGHFHRSFYRAVEATSVTPWASRALDRALAAIVVAAARHINPGLTQDAAVKEMINQPATRAAVRDAIVDRAPQEAIPGGKAALADLIDVLFDAWIATADEQIKGGNTFVYARNPSPHRLLHMPLAPELENLSPAHQRFVAGRSMRDVEANVTINPRDPWGNAIANADDLKMTKNAQRLSQVVSSFGPGAMVDLPTRSVVIGGLELWEMRTGSFTPIPEPRLTARLEQFLKAQNRLAPTTNLSLRTPPIDQGRPGQLPNYIIAPIFPAYFVCEQVEIGAAGSGTARRRRLVPWQSLDTRGGRRKFVFDDGKKSDVTPIRFVCACKNGHMQDIEWKWIVHRGQACENPMWMEERGTSADPADLTVVCGCGKQLSLQTLFLPGLLGDCRGERPWLLDRDPNGCDQKLKLLTRTATNTYFPQVDTVISLPTAEDELTRLVDSLSGELANVQSVADVGPAKRFNSKVRAALESYPDEEIFARLVRIREGAIVDNSGSPKIAEFDVFASGRPEIGQNLPSAKLYAQTLPRDAWTEPAAEVDLSVIKSIVAVHRLRAVSCLYGFTRFEAAPTSADGELEDVGLAVHGAPISRDADWLPAIEQFGEGIFIHFDEARIAQWLAAAPAQARHERLHYGYLQWRKKFAKPPKYPGTAYVLLHSLAHALMTEIALDCGYPASSLKERVYALSGADGAPERCGILIYTATAGAQGTLGGLVGTATRFSQILSNALDRATVCSNDPICADHEPDDHGGDRATHGAACHGCLLISETSCEMRNMFLDRSLLIPTMSPQRSAFFCFESQAESVVGTR